MSHAELSGQGENFPLGDFFLYIPVSAIEPIDKVRYDATQALARFCIESETTDIVFIDRSARLAWTALSTYMSLAMPDINKPNAHFINPYPFNKDQYSPWTWIIKPFYVSKATDEIKQTKHRFIEDADNRSLLLLDSCVHSGKTMHGVTKLFRDRLGFSNIMTGAFTLDSFDSPKPKLDFVYTEDLATIP